VGRAAFRPVDAPRPPSSGRGRGPRCVRRGQMS
jgi:hypothetical protein